MSIQGIEIGVDWDRADTSKQHALGTQLPRVGGFVMATLKLVKLWSEGL